MGSQAQDQQQGSQGLASIYELAKMAYLCNDWGSEAPMRSCELSDEALLACCKAGTAAGLKQPSRGPVRTDSVDLRSISSVSGPHLEHAVPATGTLDQTEFLADNFRINSFKVAECHNKEPHDWTLCVFAHPGEKARRRDPAQHKYVATACPDFRKGTCKRGDICPFAHGVFESWLHPSKYRTQLCKDGMQCQRPVCFFAHTMQQLRLGTLPKSLDSPDGCHFAAYYGGPAYGRMRGTSHLQASTGEPSSPDASSASGESSLAMLEGASMPGSAISDEIEWLHGSHKEQLRRLAAMSVRTSQCDCAVHPAPGISEILPPALTASLKAQLAAFLLGDGNASSTAMRSAAQLVQLLESQPAHQAPAQCLPMLPTGLSPGLPYAHASVPLASTQAHPCACHAAGHQVPLSRALAARVQSAPASACMVPPTSTADLPVAVPPLVASIWGPLPTGRPSAEWQPSQGPAPSQAVPASREQLVPEAPPLSPHHRQCSAY